MDGPWDKSASRGAVVPVILAGGSGSRLWPLSREPSPTQYLPLAGGLSLVQAALERIAGPQLFAPPIIVANEAHRFLLAEHVRRLGAEPWLQVLEPVGRDTAPAVALAAVAAVEFDPHAVLLVMPADHVIGDPARFAAAVAAALPAARQGWLVAFGVTPRTACTAYGCIERSHPLGRHDGLYSIKRFAEPAESAAAGSVPERGGCL